MALVLQVLNGLTFASFLFLLSTGLNLIFGVMRIVNFAHGSLAMLGAYVAFAAAGGVTGKFWVGTLAALAVLALLGIALERGLLRFLYAREELYQILLTYGVVLVSEDAVKLIWGRDYKSLSFPPPFAGPVQVGSALFPSYYLALMATAAAVALCLWVVLYRTRVGAVIRAASADREMTEALGYSVPALGAAVFAAGSALAGLAGALILPIQTVSPGFAVEVVIEAFIVVVVGGLGSIWGALVGAVFIGLLRSFGIAYFPVFELALVYLTMAAILIVRPWGLLGVPPVGRN